MIQLVDTVNEMQEGSVFHRDLQLDNIVIERDEDWRGPRVRIIDFGRACFIDPAYCNYNGTSPVVLNQTSSMDPFN